MEHEIKIVMCVLVGEEDSWEAESFLFIGVCHTKIFTLWIDHF